MRTNGKASWQLFPKRWSLSNPNRIKSIMNKHKVKHHRNSETKNRQQSTHIRTKTPVEKKHTTRNLYLGFQTKSGTSWSVRPQKHVLLRNCTTYVAKPKALISWAVTTQLICAFCFHLCIKQVSFLITRLI